MTTGEGRSVEVDTELLSIELVGAAGGHAWVRESERNLLVAFDLETGRESFRHEGARRVRVLDDVVLSEDGGVVTAIDPATGTPRRVGDRPARDVLGATATHLWCTQAHAETVQGLDLASGAPKNAIRLDAAPLPGLATAAGEIALRLRDGHVVVLAAEGETARVARVIDVAREPRDAILPPIATPGALLVPVVEATAQGPRTRLLSLATPELAVRAEADLAAQIVQASGALVAMSDGARTIVIAIAIDGARRLDLPGTLVALRDPRVITRRGDTCFLGVLTNDTAARVALPAVPDAREAVVGPRTIAWRAGSRLVLLDLASIPLVDGSAFDLAIESHQPVESAEITFVSPRGIISMVSPRFGWPTASTRRLRATRSRPRASTSTGSIRSGRAPSRCASRA